MTSMIDQDMIDVIESAKLMFVATVRSDGTPNLSPKGSVRVLDGAHLIFADIASPQTVENLRARPSVEVNVVDFLRRRGYRFRGTAEILEPGDRDFAWIAAWLRDTNGDGVPCHHAVKITVSEVTEVLSPAYTHQHVPEPELRSAWVAKYGLAQP
jgi:predicted pyridoxine 5'-phosphate oxidase superfamily flavin-nucleotide-binding protein